MRRPGMCRGAQAAYDHCAFAKMGIDKVTFFENFKNHNWYFYDKV